MIIERLVSPIPVITKMEWDVERKSVYFFWRYSIKRRKISREIGTDKGKYVQGFHVCKYFMPKPTEKLYENLMFSYKLEQYIKIYEYRFELFSPHKHNTYT